MYFDKPKLGVRLGSMLLHHFIMCSVIVVPVLPLTMMNASIPGKENTQPAWFQFLFLGLMFLYFLKDSFKGRSPAKRIVKLQVVDNKTNLPASVGQCFVRNILIILWPVEVLVTFFNTQRRLGDYLAGTKVIYLYPLHNLLDELELANATHTTNTL
jgi:uncharacterized RDD family membrane protein YckC